MGVIFWLFSYVLAYITILLLALSLTAGLYMLAELAEEFPTLTGKIIKYTLITILFLQIILWLDGLPTRASVIGFVAHLTYAFMLKDFPLVQFLSISSLCAAVAFIATNFIWLQYFIDSDYELLQVLGFFLVFVWTIPCGLFVSLSVNDHVLPGSVKGGSAQLNDFGNSSKKSSLFKSVFESVWLFIDQISSKLGMSLHTGLNDARKLTYDKRR